MPHDVQRPLKAYRAQRRFRLLPGPREIAGLAIGQAARRDLDDGRLRRGAVGPDLRHQRRHRRNAGQKR